MGAAIGASVVLFSRSGDLIDASFSFQAPAGRGSLLDLLVTDLAPGTWQITAPGGRRSTCKVTATAQSCWLSGPAGAYQLEPIDG